MSVTLRKTNLRRPGTSFIGRAAELQAVDAALATAPLCTIVGPPGSGKTRIGMEYALTKVDELADAAAGGVWLCDLTEVSTAGGICRVVAREMEVGLTIEGGVDDAAQHIGAALAARGPMLLVLDGFEHLVRVGAELIAGWLDAAPEALLLITSRERVGLAAERVVEIGPLAPPVGDAVSNEAVQLFVERARAAHHAFQLGDTDVAAVAELVRRLDGLPLAIELAAARMTVLGPKQLLQRLGLDVLGRDRSARRSSLRMTLDWSWQQLAAHEQSAMAQLSVFRAGFMLEAAEAVIDLSAHPDAPAVLDVLQSLRDKSLLAASEAPELPGEARFGLLETIRTYAEERLREAGDAGAAETRHARHYLEAGWRWCAAVDRAGGPSCLRRLALELPNLVEVHRRALARTDGTGNELRAVLALEPLFFTRGPTGLCLTMVTEALEHAARHGADRTLVVLGLKARGRALRDLGRVDEARAELARALTMAGAAADRGAAGRVRAHLASLSSADAARALQGFEEALADVRAAGDARTEALVLGALADVHRRLGELEAAASICEEAIDAARAQGNLYGVAFALMTRAELQRARGRPEAARSDLERALQAFHQLGERRYEGIALTHLGVLHEEQGRVDEARRTIERAIVCHGEYGSRWLEAAALGALAELERSEGRMEDARRLYVEVAAVVRDGRDASAEIRWLCGLATVEAALNRPAEAKSVCAEVRTLLSSSARAADSTTCLLVDLSEALVEVLLDPSASHASRIAQLQARAGALPEQPPAIRSALRMLARRAAGAPDTDHPPGDAAALLVCSSGRWFQPHDAPRVSLQRRHALRLIVQRLVRERLDHPGRALDVPALLEAGWPGEKVRVQAGVLRVYTALSTLRRMGLRHLLLSRDDGYLLDPKVRVSQLSEPPAP